MTDEKLRLYREGFAFDSERDCVAARELLAYIDDLHRHVKTLEDALAVLQQECLQNEAAIIEVIKERDLREEQIASIYYELGGQNEWSNLHDLGDEAQGLADGIDKRLGQLRKDNEDLSAAVFRCKATESRVKTLEDALEILSRLGNEPNLGNSRGNVIAQQALAAKESK